MACFNPRTHTGCDGVAFVALTLTTGFNPRTHTGCDAFVQVHLQQFRVSIHAPTRGATDKSSSIKRSSTSFNPRTHTGCDSCRCSYALYVRVSIHAPTRGATDARAKDTRDKAFQSTHPHGVRHRLFLSKMYQHCFNPRTHTGCDLHYSKLSSRTPCFNPRTHTGCDVHIVC